MVEVQISEVDALPAPAPGLLKNGLGLFSVVGLHVTSHTIFS
jgi:hypothetical protein